MGSVKVLNSPPKEGASILIILMGSLGDVVRGLALVSQIKENFPTVKISWLIEKRFVEVVALAQGIDAIFVFDRKNWFSSMRELAVKFRNEKFDFTLDLQRIFKSGVFSLLSRAKRRIGFHRKNSKEFNYLFNNEKVPYLEESAIPKLTHYLTFIRALGGDVKEPIRFSLRKADLNKDLIATLDLLGREFIGVVMGSTWETKNWPLEGYSGLISLVLKETSHPIVLLGDKGQSQNQEKLITSFNSPRILGLCGKTTLTDLVAVVSRAKACVGPDSGPLHIASAFEVPYVSLFGPTSLKRVAPYGNEELAIESTVGCSPCYRKKCPGLGTVCMKLIGVNEVYGALKRALHMGTFR